MAQANVPVIKGRICCWLSTVRHVSLSTRKIYRPGPNFATSRPGTIVSSPQDPGGVIAVFFGPTSPKIMCPQKTVIEPTTVYGISKYAGEFWCNYYFNKYGVDVRSIRYPGLISYKSAPGGGTTDYAIDIYKEALEEKKYTCFLSEDTYLPMMYMPDAIRATIELMEAPSSAINIRTSYNVAGMSFSPKEIASVIQGHLPEFEMSYQPDYRQDIANSWPQSIDDSIAAQQWGWKPSFDLGLMTVDMLENMKK